MPGKIINERIKKASNFYFLAKNLLRNKDIKTVTKNYFLGHIAISSYCVFLLNPWRYSHEQPRPTEVVAAGWQYRGPYS